MESPRIPHSEHAGNNRVQMLRGNVFSKKNTTTYPDLGIPPRVERAHQFVPPDDLSYNENLIVT